MLISLTLFVCRAGVRGERPNLKFHEEIFNARLSKLSLRGCPVCPYRVPVSHKGEYFTAIQQKAHQIFQSVDLNSFVLL
jgi:hypothetical protein